MEGEVGVARLFVHFVHSRTAWEIVQNKKPVIRFAHLGSFLFAPNHRQARVCFKHKSPALSCKAFSSVGVARLFVHFVHSRTAWEIVQNKKPVIRFAHLGSFLFAPNHRQARVCFKHKSPALSCKAFSSVGVARLELTTLWSQTRCATNCATPRK
jgi:hypothetical protein